MGQAKRTNNKRRFPECDGPRPDNKKIKIEEAIERTKYWVGLTPIAQLEALDNRLGKGIGAKKQRAQIQARIDGLKKAPEQPAKVTDVAEGETEKRLRAKERRELSQQKRPSK